MLQCPESFMDLSDHIVNYRSRLDVLIDHHKVSFDLSWNESGCLKSISLADASVPLLESHEPPYSIAVLKRELKLYFSTGEPLMPVTWTTVDTTQVSDFQKKVFEATSLIPHGETRTYSWVATKIGKPLAARAVGQALRRNPIPILVPCHRVVSDKSLGGFMGADEPTDLELRLKHWLLELERSYRNPSFDFVTSRPRLVECVS